MDKQEMQAILDEVHAKIVENEQDEQGTEVEMNALYWLGRAVEIGLEKTITRYKEAIIGIYTEDNKV